MTFADNGAGAGQDNGVLIFTNTSSTPCTLQGYPGADGLDAGGRSLAHASRVGAAGQTVTLAAGAKASAMTTGALMKPDATPCGSFAALLVTPPNTTTSTKIAAVRPQCNFTVSAVVLGSTGTVG